VWQLQRSHPVDAGSVADKAAVLGVHDIRDKFISQTQSVEEPLSSEQTTEYCRSMYLQKFQMLIPHFLLKKDSQAVNYFIFITERLFIKIIPN
jgi:hypothetical protein